MGVHCHCRWYWYLPAGALTCLLALIVLGILYAPYTVYGVFDLPVWQHFVSRPLRLLLRREDTKPETPRHENLWNFRVEVYSFCMSI
jgi:hypothetical protein